MDFWLLGYDLLLESINKEIKDVKKNYFLICVMENNKENKYN